MQQSDFSLKRNTNPNKIKKTAKINKFEQSIYQNSVIDFFIIVLTSYIVALVLFWYQLFCG